MTKTLFLTLLLLLSVNLVKAQKSISIFSGSDHPKVQFALDELKSVLVKAKYQIKTADFQHADIALVICTGQEAGKTGFQLKPEGFYIQKNSSGKIGVTGADEAGLMYGGLELAEQIKLYGVKGIQETQQNPYMELRGTKFNIPLDVRTPSYSDASDAAQKNIPEMWSFDFWKEYIDNLARYRYNYISLWNLHPFPSMVKVPGYPDVALDDVLRSTTEWEENYHPWGTEFDKPEILAQTEVIKKITIDEKIDFWRKVMAYAKGRNIDFYILTWNIFVNGTDGKYGITDKIDNPVTRDYFRKSVKQMFVTYPDLAGIGLTTGENMDGIKSSDREDWAFDTYARGVLDAAREMPDRKFTFIHRQHQTGAKEIADRFKALTDQKNIEFLFSFKYAQAHVMSATRQPDVDKFVKDIEGMKTIWTLRNDDNFYFRWGAPDFVRGFIKNIPYQVSRGFYYGSDNYVWGKEFLMKQPETPRQIEIVKHWYHWMMWGRLGYNPELSDERFMAMLQNRFPEVDADRLFTTWQQASMIYPTTTAFHWGRIDVLWFIEGCRSRPGPAKTETGFHDVNTFINYPVHAYSGCQTIPEFVKTVVSGEKSLLLSPFDVSAKLDSLADKVLENLKTMDAKSNQELSVTLHDIRTMALLGKYYSRKIAGSANVALYRETKNKKYQDEAILQLTSALGYWEKFTETALQQNINPLWTNRVGYVDWVKTTGEVKKDIEIAKLNQI